MAFPLLNAYLQSHFDCNTIEGMQLENEGGGGSLGSHWERIIAYNEMMSSAAF